MWPQPSFLDFHIDNHYIAQAKLRYPIAFQGHMSPKVNVKRSIRGHASCRQANIFIPVVFNKHCTKKFIVHGEFLSPIAFQGHRSYVAKGQGQAKHLGTYIL